ncbi:AAA family ATPase [Natronoglycomyces albus]|uniref:AAA family ATPase n=1 Tax=Natronoglycomyces albus TaxID=2811108 RepID=A0A895XN98_9ACTN|nr:ATP-binding protein [Natronoglycomyces albus]QSB05013.1 AAA family ATPase [Natronoglycomyces albus]
MLIRFEVSNFRSILDPVELSMVAIDEDRPAARAQEPLGHSLLTTAGIYGPNASGKSNLLRALGWLQEAIRTSLVSWDDGISVEPFAFALPEGRETSFEIELAIEGVRFQYVLSLDASSVHYEALFHYPNRKQRLLFERHGADEFKLQRGLGHLSGTRKLLAPRVLALTAVRRFDDPLVSGLLRKILGMDLYGADSFSNLRRCGSASRMSRKLFDPSQSTAKAEKQDEGRPVADVLERRLRALAMLRMADRSIEDVEFKPDPDIEAVLKSGSDDHPKWMKYAFERLGDHQRPHLIYRTHSGSASLDFNHSVSDGTRTWFNLIGPVLEALDQGKVLAVDELDSSLHPTLSAQLIDMFHRADTNPYGAQLIFTSHDTSLLKHLNRDEVWLTEKNDDGSTQLGSLADFAEEYVRKGSNLEKAYLSGRFGAVPDVSDQDFLRALGLIG